MWRLFDLVLMSGGGQLKHQREEKKGKSDDEIVDVRCPGVVLIIVSRNGISNGSNREGGVNGVCHPMTKRGVARQLPAVGLRLTGPDVGPLYSFPVNRLCPPSKSTVFSYMGTKMLQQAITVRNLAFLEVSSSRLFLSH